MTMPKFEPVAWRYELKAGEYTFAEKRYLNETYALRPTAIHTADQLVEAYEAGKRDAIPEGYVLVPKEPTEKMLTAMSSSGWLTGNYKAMLTSAPKGEE